MDDGNKIKHPLHGGDLEKVPSFALIQFDRTRRSAFWNGAEWIEIPKEDYKHFVLFARALRIAETPQKFLEEFALVLNKENN